MHKMKAGNICLQMILMLRRLCKLNFMMRRK